MEPFYGESHVVYMDNFYTSGHPLIHELAKHETYVVGKIKQSAAGFPSELTGVKLAKGEYIAKTVNSVCYFVFHDCQIQMYFLKACLTLYSEFKQTVLYMHKGFPLCYQHTISTWEG